MNNDYLANLSFDVSPENVAYQMENSINLIGDLLSQSQEAKARAIEKLKSISYNLRELLDKKVRMAMLEALAGVEETGLKIDIIVSLGLTRDPVVLPLLRKLLLEAPDFELKKAAAFALGEMKFVGPADDLIQALSFDDVGLQIVIIEALSKINERSVAPALVEACKKVSNKVKFAVCGLLCKFEIPQGYEFIKKALGHESNAVKKEALLVAREFPGEIFLGPLRAIVSAAGLPAEILALGIEAISKINQPEAAGEIIKHLHDEEFPEVRAMAVKALGELGDTSHVGAITECLSDTDEAVKINAALALGELKMPEVIPQLLNIIDSPSEKVRIAVITAVRSLTFWLSDISEKNRVTYALMAMVRDSSESVRAISIEALGYLENPDSIEVLLEAVNDESRQVRENVAAALGSFNDDRVIMTLGEFLGSSEVVIRWNAITSLAKIGDVRVLPVISRLLSDPDESVRMAAKSFVDNFAPPAAEEEKKPV